MIEENLSKLRERIELVCKRTGREAASVHLILVTKQVKPEVIKAAYDLGVRDFGESRIQEWLRKKSELPDDIRWHFIGHLQTNKVKFCADECHLIHSVDSVRLALALDQAARKRNAVLDCLLEVNTLGEGTKQGIAISELARAVSEIRKLGGVRIKGLMTIGPFTDDSAKTRVAFRQLAELRSELRGKFPDVEFEFLSMGMSSDFEIAIEEGADLLRVGSAVFGERVKT